MPDRSTSPDSPSSYPRGSLFAALPVYAEALITNACVLVLGASELDVGMQLLELGARSVDVYDPDAARASKAASCTESNVAFRPLEGAIGAGKGAFDLAIIPDLSVLWGVGLSATVSELRRVLAEGGAVVAMGRARTDDERSGAFPDAFPDLGPAALTYGELYELFARQFEQVTMTGVVPFSGVVFAALGEADDLPVSVDTRLSDEGGPEAFVVLASDALGAALEPYSIVQVPGRAGDASSEEGDGRGLQALLDRDAAITRAVQLEEIAVAARQSMALMERRLSVAEDEIVERDGQIAELADQMVSLRAESENLIATASAEIAEAHASETGSLEAQLRDRARIIAEMERELVRREHLVKELVATVEELRSGTSPFAFEASPPMLSPVDSAANANGEELTRYRRKLDELALEVARRDGELRAQAWRITELENALAAAPAEPVVPIASAADAAPPIAIASAADEPTEPTESAEEPTGAAPAQGLELDLARANEELAVLRQALVQEHAARVAAEALVHGR
ncbi:MAG: hypothetical protein FWD73_16830 [Polyangiaceae bacterium]|nr:hypothetical protein [Polyangiaceae bacterium]